MWLFKSSVGRKFVMSLTGAFLVLFVTFHVLMNAVAILWPGAYNTVCEFLGANWYALIGSAVLAAGFLIHILYACWLTIQNRKARGNDRYAVTTKPVGVEWASQNMLVLGIVIVAFLGVHMIQFWAKMQLAEVMGFTVTGAEGAPMPPAAGTLFIQAAFSQWWTLPIYLIGFVALWFHMTHGFWSMFQTAGWNGRTWLPRLKKIANWFTTIVVGLFIIEACWFTYQAKQNAYLSDPELRQSYFEQAVAPLKAQAEQLNSEAANIDQSTPEGAKQMADLQEKAQAMDAQYLNILKAYMPDQYEQAMKQQEMMKQMQAQQAQPYQELNEVPDSAKVE